jgi:hypothetical protein
MEPPATATDSGRGVLLNPPKIGGHPNDAYLCLEVKYLCLSDPFIEGN